MIKLNNKNITYVALADTNNSIKAPKEIWYADTNNSVKLVYRRKDALIEGEDYEKYHWLDGDGSAIIEVIGNIYRDTFSLVTIPTTTTNKKLLSSMGTTYDGNISEYQIMVGGSSEFTIRHGIRINNRPTSIIKDFSGNYINNEYEITTYRDGDYYYGNINGVEYKNDMNFGEYQFADKDIVINIYSNRFKLGNFNSGRVNLIPCKLLKPVPKWLDANGIRRQVGECGMIDLVSGKFYGNVNSVGTFTVENYYERKEWLKGDGSAYMQISQTSRTDFNINLTYKLSNVYKQMLYGSFYSTSGGWKGNMLTWGESNGIADKILLRISTSNGNNYINLGAQNVDVVHTIKVVDGRCYFDDVDKGVCPGYSIYNYDKPFLLFNGYNVNTITESNASNASISKFSIEGYCNLIPCTLTMDLPASMDANNIARTKGTSGMWDLVSDRFYGNVANSGTFKAVNLAEGVDYEVHDILKTLAENTSSAPYDVAYFRFPNHIPLIGKVLTLKLGNVYRDYNLEGDIVNNARYYILIYRIGSITTIQERLGNTVLNSVSNSSSTVKIDFDNNVVSVGTSTMNIQGTGYYTFGENNVSWSTGKYLKGLTISDVLNLIPVKLLRSIPAKYDANGIARQVGECGMYDTVNDVFYGNVASSGTFTVEDD